MYNILVKNIKKYLEWSNKSIIDLSIDSGLKVSTIVSLVNNRKKRLSFITITKIADAMKCRPDDIMKVRINSFSKYYEQPILGKGGMGLLVEAIIEAENNHSNFFSEINHMEKASIYSTYFDFNLKAKKYCSN
jgi:DNA-binding Xre family transcriptional regulator